VSYRYPFLAGLNPVSNDPLRGSHSRSHQKSLMPAGIDATDYHGDSYSLWCPFHHPIGLVDKAQVSAEAEEATGIETGLNEGQSRRYLREA